MDALGNRLRRAFDMRPLPQRKKPTTNNRDNLSASRRAASLDALADYRHPQDTVVDSMFGGMIGDAVDETTGINKFVQWCVDAIETTGDGLKTDGIYRVTAGQVGAKRISWQAERSMPRVLQRESNVHVLTAALKLFFKSLEQPIMRVEDFQIAMQPHLNDTESAEMLRQVVYSLPLAERSTLAYLFVHLRRVVDVKENNMTLATLSASFGPTLLRLRTELAAQASMAKDMKQQNRLVSQLLLHAEVIFGPAFTTQATVSDVTDNASDGESDTSSVTSDDAESTSSSIKKKNKKLVATADKHKAKSTNSVKNKKLIEETIDSTSSDESQADSPLNQREVVASVDNYKRNSSLSTKKESVFRDKISSSSSNDTNANSLAKKQVLVAKADSKKRSSLKVTEEIVFRDKISSSSSNDTNTNSVEKKHDVLVASTESKKRSSLKAKREGMLRDTIDSSSSFEGIGKRSANKENALIARGENAKRHSSLSTHKERVFQDNKIEPPFFDQDNPKAPGMKQTLVASADIYKREYSLEANKEDEVRDKIESSSSFEEKSRTPSKLHVLFASTNPHRGISSLPAGSSDLLFQENIDSSSSDEIKDNSDKVSKQTSKAKTIFKKMRNKLFPFRTAKNKHKSSSSLNEEHSGSTNQEEMTIYEIDAMSVKPDSVSESRTSGVSPITMTTFKYSQPSDLDQKLKYQSGGIVANKMVANPKEKKMADGLLRFRLISSSSSSDDEDHSSTANKLKKPTVTAIGTTKGESASKVNTYSKTAVRPEQKHATLTDLLEEGTVNMPQTKMKIPPPKIPQNSSSNIGKHLATSAEKHQPLMASEVIDITERTVDVNKSSEISNVSSVNTKRPTSLDDEGKNNHLGSTDNLKHTLNKNEGYTVKGRNDESKALSLRDDISNKQNITMEVNHANVYSKTECISQKILLNNSNEENRHVTVSTTNYGSPTFAHSGNSSDADFPSSSNPSLPSKDSVPETEENVIYATVQHKLKPSALTAPPDIFKPTPTLTEVFNSSSIHSINYAPPLELGHQTNGNANTLEGSLKKRASSSSSSSESFSDSSEDSPPSRPPPPPPPMQFQSTAGIRIHPNVPTAL